MRKPELNDHPAHAPAPNGKGAFAPTALAEPCDAELLAATLDAVGVGAWALDLEGRCLFINQAACGMLGRSREECLGEMLQCRIHACRSDGWVCAKQNCHFQSALESGFASKVDNEVFCRGDGTAFDAEYSVHPLIVRGRTSGCVISVCDVTARKRAQEELRESDEWLRLAQNAAGVGIFDLDLKTGAVKNSEGQFRVLGLDPAGEGPSFEQWRDLVHPEDRDRMKRLHELTLSGDQPPGEEYRVVWPDGSVHWLFTRPRVFFDEAGKPARLVGANVDITGRMRAETTLNQFFSASPTPLAVWGLDGCIQRTNSAWEPILGFTAEELKGRSLFDFVHPDDRAATAAEFETLLAKGERLGFECRAVRNDGQQRWLLVDARVLKDAEAIVATMQDITGRKAAEEALRESEALFRSAFDNTLFGMAIVSPDGRFLEANPSLCGMTGFAEQEFLQTDIASMTHPEERQASLELMRTMVEGVEPAGELTKRYARKDGGWVWTRIHVTAVRDTQGAPLYFVTLFEDLTDQKCAEEAARISEERLKFTLDSAGIGLCYHELGETVASDQQFRLYGLEPAEEWVSRERWLQTIHPEDRERVQAMQRTAGELDKPYDLQFRVIWPDGSIHWLLCREKALGLEGSRPRAEITVDVTESRRAEADLDGLINTSRSPIAVFGFDGRIKRFNAALLRTSGFTAEELTSRPAIEFFHPDDRAKMRAELGRLITRGGDAEFECRGLCKDGSIVWLVFSATAAPDEELIFTVAHDVTRRKRAEAALAAEALQRRTVFEQSRDGIVVFDGNGKVRQSNRSFANMLGYSLDEMLQLHVWDWDDQLTQDQVRAMMREVDSLPPTFETRHKRKDGSRLDVEISTVSVEVGGDAIYYAVVRDISVRKQMEESARAHAQQLARSNEELERFAYVASHDLQEPLRMVASFTQLLSKKYSGKLDETADRYINFAVDGAKRMQALISDLLAYSRVNSKDLDLRPTDCGAVARGTLQNLRAAIEESGAVVEWDPLPVVTADPGQLGQLFQNLIGNAVKFHGQAAPRVHIAAADNGADWLFSVRDNGIGIDPGQAERVFQIFQRLHSREQYAGTGIGLAVCQKVVERHGGRIWVESKPGQGADFRFTLPKTLENGVTNASA